MALWSSAVFHHIFCNISLGIWTPKVFLWELWSNVHTFFFRGGERYEWGKEYLCTENINNLLWGFACWISQINDIFLDSLINCLCLRWLSVWCYIWLAAALTTLTFDRFTRTWRVILSVNQQIYVCEFPSNSFLFVTGNLSFQYRLCRGEAPVACPACVGVLSSVPGSGASFPPPL